MRELSSHFLTKKISSVIYLIINQDKMSTKTKVDKYINFKTSVEKRLKTLENRYDVLENQLNCGTLVFKGNSYIALLTFSTY